MSASVCSRCGHRASRSGFQRLVERLAEGVNRSACYALGEVRQVCRAVNAPASLAGRYRLREVSLGDGRSAIFSRRSSIVTIAIISRKALPA